MTGQRNKGVGRESVMNKQYYVWIRHWRKSVFNVILILSTVYLLSSNLNSRGFRWFHGPEGVVLGI